MDEVQRARRRISGLAAAAAISVLVLVFGSGTAQASPMPAANVARAEQTGDGWNLKVALTGMLINAVPNMAATPFTKEGFVTGRATASIEGDGALPVTASEVILGVQLGCQTDLSLGGTASVGGGGGVGVAGGGGGVSGSVNASIFPSASVSLMPGNIRTLVLGQWSLKGPLGEISVSDAHVKVDGCAGPVPIRFFAHAQLETDRGSDSVNAYGEILNL